MYLGIHQIKAIAPDGDHVRVSFEAAEEDGQKVDVPDLVTSQRYVDEMQTEKPLDLSEYDQKEKVFISEGIYKLLLTHGVRVSSITRILDNLIYSITTNEQNALGKMIGKEYHDRTLLDLKV